MGKIVGWDSIDSDDAYQTSDVKPEVEPQSVQSNQMVFEPSDLSTKDCDCQGSSSVIPSDNDDEDEQPASSFDDIANGDLEDGAAAIESTHQHEVLTDEAVSFESLEITQASAPVQYVNQGEYCTTVESDKTDRICQAIGDLKPLYLSDSFSRTCDITAAANGVIRALILAADPSELDYFRILEKLQEVVCRADAEASNRSKLFTSPNLNSLIEFVSKLAAQ